VRGDHVGQTVYNQHLRGASAFAQNGTSTRLGILQRMHVRTLTELSVNRFDWCMPKTVNKRFLNLTLFASGLSVFVNDKEYGFLALKAASVGALNMYDEPVSFTTMGNGYNGSELSLDECVPIWSNYMRIPDHDIIAIYASKLADIDMSIEINVHNARRGKVVVSTDNTKLSAANIVRQIDEGLATLNVNTSIGDMITALDLGIDTVSILNLSIQRARWMNEVMDLLGIDNSNQDKKERLVSAEVDANNDQTNARKNIALGALQEACEKINDMFGAKLDEPVSVRFKSDTAAEETEDDEDDKEIK